MAMRVIKRPSTTTVRPKRNSFKPKSGSGKGPFPVGKRRSAFSDAKKRAGGLTGYSGAKGFDQSKKEKVKSDRQREKNSLPFRLWMPQDSEREVTVISDQPYFMYEHEIKNPNGKIPLHERCIKDQGHCPLCDKLGREGYWVMVLEVIDHSQYKNNKGKTVKASKKLAVIKSGLHPKYKRLYDRNGGSFKGMRLHLSRDGQRDFTTGGDIELVKIVNAAGLAKYGDLAKPINLEKAFEPLTEKEMRQQYGGAAVMGSRDFGDDDDDDDDSADGDDWD